jgi:hypothetical protein
MMDVFLSASVPLPSRDEHFYESADVVGIREAVKSLVIEVARKGRLTFGGHPAITPLISLVLRQSFPDKVGSFVLYQSEYFLRKFPKENDAFIDVHVTPAVDDNRAESLALMRREMLTHCRYDAAFFIGGMEGVIEEFEMLRALQPDVPVYPIASTGGASLDLYRRGEWDTLLMDELTYPTLFRKLLQAS